MERNIYEILSRKSEHSHNKTTTTHKLTPPKVVQEVTFPYVSYSQKNSRKTQEVIQYGL